MAKSSRELLITLGADTTTFSQKIKRAKDLTKELDSQFKLISSSSEGFEDALQGIGKKQDLLADKMKICNNVTDAYVDKMKEQQEILNNVSKEQKYYTRQQDALAKALESVKDKGSSAYKALSDKMEEVSGKVKNLNKDVKTHTDRMIGLNKGYNDNQLAIQQFTKEIVELDNKMETLNKNASFDNINEDIKESQRVFDNMRTSTEGFDKSMEGLVKTKEHYSQQLEKSKGLLEQYSKEIKQSNTFIEKQESSIEELTKEVNQYQNALDGMKSTDSGFDYTAKKLEELRKELVTANTNVEHHKDRISELTKQYRQTENQIASFTGKINQVSSSMKAMEDGITFEKTTKEIKYLNDVQIKNLQSKLKELKTDFNTVKNTTDTFADSMQGLGNKLTAQKEMFTVVKKAVKAYEEQLESLGNESKDLSAEIKKLENNLNRYEKQLAQIDKEQNPKKWQELADKIGVTNTKHKELTEQLTVLNNKTKQSEQGLESMRNEHTKLASEMKKTTSAMQKMKDGVSFQEIIRETKTLSEVGIKGLEENVKSLNLNLQRMETESDNLSNSLGGLVGKSKLLNTTLKATTNLGDALQKELKQNSNTITELTAKSNKYSQELKELEKQLSSGKLKGENWDKQNDKLKKLEVKYKDVNAEIDAHIKQQGVLEKKYSSVEKELSKIEAQLNATNAEMKSFNNGNKFDEIENSLEAVRHEFDMFGAKMELLKSKFVDFDNSIKGAMQESKLLKQQTQQLREEFEHQQSAINKYQNEINQLAIKYDSLTNQIKETKLAMIGMDESTPKFASTVANLNRMEIELEQVDTEIKEVTRSMREMEVASMGTMTNINNNITQSHRGWELLGTRIKGVGDHFINLGNNMQSLGASMMPLTMGVTALGAGVVTTGAKFEQSMSKVQALTQASKTEMKKLTDTARELGKETVFSATEASEGLQYLALAGYDVSDSMSALPIILDGAMAGAMDLATTSDLATDVLASLGENADFTGEKVKDLEVLMNQTALASSKSNFSMQELLESYIRFGGSAQKLNIPLSTSNTLLGIMADQGVKGSEAGRALTSMFTNLTKESGESAKALEKYGISAFDANDKIKPMEEVLYDVKKRFEELGGAGSKDAIELVDMLGGKIHSSNLIKLLSGISTETKGFTEHYKGLKKEFETAVDTSALETMADTMTDNLIGKFETMKSALQESFLSIFEQLAPKLTDIVEHITKIIEKLTKTDTLTNIFSSLLDVVHKVVTWFEKLSPKAQETIIKFTTMAGVLAPLLTIFGFVTSGIGHIVKGFGGFVLISGKVLTKIGLMSKGGFSLGAMFTKFSGIIKTAVTPVLAGLSAVALPAIAVALTAVGAVVGDNEMALTNLAEKWGFFGQVIGGICEFVSGVVQLTFGNVGILLKTLAGVVGDFLKGDLKNIDDTWEKGMASMSANTSKAMSNITLESTRAIDRLRDISSKDLGEITTVFEKAFETLPTITDKNLSEVAKTFTETFKATNRDVLDLSKSTITALRGTSDTMATLFNGISAEMDITEATKLFEDNMNTLLLTGGATTESLKRDFEEAQRVIDANLVDGMSRTVKNAEDVLEGFGIIAKGQIEAGVINIVDGLEDLDQRSLETLRGLSVNWNTIFGNIKTDGSMSVEEMKNEMIKNLERLGLETPEQLQAFAETLKSELEVAKNEGKEKGKEVGEETVNGVGEGAESVTEENKQKVKEASKEIGEGSVEGVKEGMEQVPQAVKDELAKVGVTLTNEGQVIVEDMGKKGGDAGKAYVDTLEKELPKLSGVSNTIQQNLAGIDSVRLGNVTKQLSEVNRWLGVVGGKAVDTRVKLVGLTNLPFGNTTKGLSETNKWLGTVTTSAKNLRQPMLNLTNLPFGNTTKGLSEVNKWLGTVKDGATKAREKIHPISQYNFSGVVSGLKSVNTWLNNVKNTANNTRTALQNVASAKASIASMPMEEGQPIPYSTPQGVTRDGWFDFGDINIAKFKTNGGYYEPSSMSQSNNTSNEVNGLKELLKATIEQNNILMQLLSTERPITVGVNVDGRQIAKASARYMESEISNINNRKNRLGGKF